MPVKQQLYKGTEINKGYSNYDASGGVVSCSVTEVGGSTLSEIADFVKFGVSGTIFDMGLSVIDVRAYRYTEDKAMAVVRFGRDASTNPVLAGTVNVTESTGFEFNDYSVGSTTTVYTPPMGGATSLIVNYYYKAEAGPVGRLHMHTVLDSHPGADIDALVGKTNDATYTLGSRQHPANTLRFDGAQIVPIATRTIGTTVATRYRVTYNFSRSAGLNGTTGWAKVKWLGGYVFGTTPTGNPYFPYAITYESSLYTVDRYDRATFSFPVHA